MFRKTISHISGRSGSFQLDEIRPAFDEHFWTWYLDSYSRLPSPGDGLNLLSGGSLKVSQDILPFDSKKYTASSTAVVTLRKYFEQLKLSVPSVNQAVAMLKSPFAHGDPLKAFQLVRYFQLSSEGLFITNENKDKCGLPINYVGAENWENVMCYLDALLFSMFANLESFEPILFISNQHPEYLVDQLSALLRLYVNLLRSGNLITTDITMRLCEVLMKLGFNEAMSHKQQDCAALFEFLTETLLMPLLTFKIDIKHDGKFNKDDDQKYSRERILFVSIPDELEQEEFHEKLEEVKRKEREKERELSPGTEDSEKGNSTKENGSPADDLSEKTAKETSEKEVHTPSDIEDNSILLEECLEHYFNNSISVRRELERRATLESLRMGGSIPGGGTGDVDAIPENVEHSPQTPSDKEKPTMEVFESMRNRSNSTSSFSRQRIGSNVRTRSSTLSIWSLDNEAKSNLTGANAGVASSKEVSLPAWMFLRLLPFYTDDNEINNINGRAHSIAQTSKEFVNRRPILPICLKRYSFNNSSSSKSQRRVIIPPIINLPNFVADDTHDVASGSYKLILESAVCHRGTSISLGHFVSVIRKDTNNVTDLSEEDAHNAVWYLYDDMKKKSRVVEKLFKEIFDTEWPYMLFYRLVASDEVMASLNNSNTSLNMVPPQGFRAKYWKDETLSPILSAGHSASGDEVDTPLKKIVSEASSASSIPIPDISPIDARYVDIRNKYFWYVIDGEKNYYKELSIPSRSGTREPSITISPQFRRNSQWSDTSMNNFNLENVAAAKSHMEETETKVQAISLNETPSTPLKWSRLKTKKSPSGLSSPQENPVSISQTISPVRLEEALNDEKKHHHHHHHMFSKRSKKKEDEYRKEKCCIV